MKKVYSLSFFRHEASAYESPRCGASQGRFFANFLPVVVRAFRSIFKPEGWELEIHCDGRVREFPYYRALWKMHELNLLTLRDEGVADTLCGAMLWRMRSLWDSEADVLACRDLDSLPSVRELKTLQRWEVSGLPVSALHDSVSHSCTAIMGGMVAVRRCPETFIWLGDTWRRFKDSQVSSGIDFNQHGSDQVFLNRLPNRPTVLSEDRQSMGERTDPRDLLSAHIGGAFHALPAQQWYDANLPDQEILAIEKEVLG